MIHEIPQSNYLFVKRLFNYVYAFRRGEFENLEKWMETARERGIDLMKHDVSAFSSRLPKMPELDGLIHFLKGEGDYPLDNTQRLLSACFVMLFNQSPRLLDQHNFDFKWSDSATARFKKLSAHLFADYLHRKNNEREILAPLYGAFVHLGTLQLLADFPNTLQNCTQTGDLYRLVNGLIPQVVHEPKNPYVGWWGSLHPELYHKRWSGGLWEEYDDVLNEALLQRDIYALYLHHPKQTEKIHSLLKILGLYRHELYCQSQGKLDKEELIHIMSLHKNTRRTIIRHPAYFYQLESL